MKQRSMTARILTLFTAILLLVSLSLPAFATGPDDWTPENAEAPVLGLDQPGETAPAETAPEETRQPEPTSASESTDSLPIETEAPTEAPTEPEETEQPQPAASEPASSASELPRGMLRFTPAGNLTLVDDLEYTGMDADGNVLSKQFITVQSRDGSFFYIIIDRTGETENVYFLNQVDLADLKAAASNEPQEIPEDQCTCTSTCMAGHINMDCPVCRVNMTQCAAIDPPQSEDQPDEPQETTPETKETSAHTDSGEEPSAQSKINPILLILIAVAALAGIAVLLWKGNLFGKGKQPPRPEYDDDDEYEDEDGDDPQAPDDDPDSEGDDGDEVYSFDPDAGDDPGEEEYSDDDSLA